MGILLRRFVSSSLKNLASDTFSLQQTGYVLTVSTLASTVSLTVFVPFIVDLLKPFYKRKVESQRYQDLVTTDEDQAAEESSIDLLQGPEETSNHPGDSQDEISNTSDHLDVHIAVASWAIEAVSYIGIGVLHSFSGQMMGELIVILVHEIYFQT